MERRNTIQHQLVLEAVRTMRRHVSADEVYEFIHHDHPSIGKGTVYRNLHILAEQGEILRVEIPGGPDRFDFTREEHYHAVCIRCGDVSDVDMDVIPDMLGQIRDPRGMKYTGYSVLLKGICVACRGAQ